MQGLVGIHKASVLKEDMNNAQLVDDTLGQSTRRVTLTSIVAGCLSTASVLFCLVSAPVILTEITDIWQEIDDNMQEFRTVSEDLWQEMHVMTPSADSRRHARQATPSLASYLRTASPPSVQSVGVSSFSQPIRGPIGPSFFSSLNRAAQAPTYRQPYSKCNCNPANRCPPGPLGEKGAPGRAGQDGQVGAKGKNGADAPDVLTIRQEFKTCFHCPAGEMGPTGSPGTIGPRGMRGAGGYGGLPGHDSTPGQPGQRGDLGKGGRTGALGLRGPSGRNAQKPIGIRGNDGRRGQRGAQGEGGTNGLNGVIGIRGPIGPPGFQGRAGSTGNIGEKGVRGLIGPYGEDAKYCACPRRKSNGQGGGY